MESAKIVNTALPPCSLTSTPKGILIGTYELDKSTGIRTGSLDLINSDLETLSTVPTDAAILDTKLAQDRIYTADSTGNVKIYDMDLNKKHNIHLSDEGLVTQIVINGDTLAATITTGELAVYNLVEEKTTFREKIHDLEAWTVEFSAEEPGASTVFTGGDDRVLSFTDLRIPYTLWKLKPHEAGVTSILPRGDNKIWTGGYDDCLNEFDLRTRRVTNTENLGGGVWRLIESPQSTSILACCMYGGLRILDPHSFGSVVGSLTNHESMVYGGLWLNDKEGITCSFYDKMLQKWKI